MPKPENQKDAKEEKGPDSPGGNAADAAGAGLPGAGERGSGGGGSGGTGASEKKEKAKINLYRFMQMKPQRGSVAALLVSKFRDETKTEEEWEAALGGLLGEKVR